MDGRQRAQALDDAHRQLDIFPTGDGRRRLNTDAFGGLLNELAFKGRSMKPLITSDILFPEINY